MSIVKFSTRGKNLTFSLDDNVIEKHMMQYTNFYEHWMLEKTPTLNGLVLDLGSNFGNHAVYYSLFTGAHEVIAVEPIWENYRNLCYNVAINGCKNIKTIYGGVGDKKGFMGWDKQGRWSQCQLKGEGTIPVFVVDDMDFKNVALIKIDCEGMDDKVLKGCMKTIKRDKPEIYIESFENPEWIDKILCPLGYKRLQQYNPAPTFHYSAR